MKILKAVVRCHLYSTTRRFFALNDLLIYLSIQRCVASGAYYIYLKIHFKLSFGDMVAKVSQKTIKEPGKTIPNKQTPNPFL